VSSSSDQTGVDFAPVAVLDENGDAVPEDANVTWEFFSKNSDGSKGSSMRTEYGAKYSGSIEPGGYIVTATLGYAHIDMPVTIATGAVADPQFDFEAGFVDLRPIHSEGQDVDENAYVQLVLPNGDTQTGYGEIKQYVPAGTTKITVTIGAASKDDSVDVTAGQHVDKDVVLGAGHANISAQYAEGQPVNEDSLYVEVFEAKKDIQGNRKSVTTGYGPVYQADLPPGDYVAQVTFDAAKVEQPFKVKAGEAVDLVITLNAGALAVTAPNGDYTEVFSAKKDIQGKRTSFGGTYDMAATRTLPAGDYHIVVTMKDGSTKEADATVKVGERTEITVE
jgi:Ca-activated chloride channel family protein